MNTLRQRGGWLIFFSILTALVLTALPTPGWAAVWQPAWVALVLIYWCMAAPGRVGVGIGWVLGLVLDIHMGTLLGQHALGLSVMAYLAYYLHQRVRVHPLWQQGLTVFGLVMVYNTITLWINGIQGRPVEFHAYLASPLVSMIIWPWVFIILRDLARRYNVS